GRPLVFHLREYSLEDIQRRAIEEHKIDALESRRTAEMRANLVEHHLRASLDRKARDAGADCRKCDRFQRVLVRASPRVDSPQTSVLPAACSLRESRGVRAAVPHH